MLQERPCKTPLGHEPRRPDVCKVCWQSCHNPLYSDLYGEPLVENKTDPPKRLMKPRLSVEEIAKKRKRCRELARQGKPCTEFKTESINPKWSYGITCVSTRFDDYLPQTVRSLKQAGFGNPRLFLDGGEAPQADFLGKRYNLPVTHRSPALKTYGNWILALYELYIREPTAKRYALFQDDCLAVSNLRQYLDQSELPEKGYLNLITHYENEEFPRAGLRGWVEAKPLRSGKKYHGKMQQGGRGAVGLVFPREAVWDLLGHQRIVNRFQDLLNGTSRVDGAIVESLNQLGWREYVHCPSLVQHIGTKSAMSNKKHPQALSFPGEEMNALDWLK